MNSKPIVTSGLSKIAPYPDILPREYLKQVIGSLVYIIEEYSPGYAISISTVTKAVQLSDWAGEQMAPPEHISKLRYVNHMFQVLTQIKVKEAAFYFGLYGEEAALVDIAVNKKMSSPGMVRDLFSKTMPIQRVIKVLPLSKEEFATFDETYQQRVIVKPATFKCIDRNGYTPLYIN